MYLYSQIVNGANVGTSFSSNFNVLLSQGIDTQADYVQGTTDYWTLPTPAEQANAVPYKISADTLLFSGAGQASTASAVEGALAGGKPVLLDIPVFSNFFAANPSNPFVDVPPSDSTPAGYHAVFAPKYDAAGVWIENSWGTGWGQGGWGELSWAFVSQYAVEGWTETAAGDLNQIDFSDDFSSYPAGQPPTGWLLRGTNGMTPSITNVGGTAGNVLSFPAVSGQYWDRWALKDTVTAVAPYTATVKMNFQSSVADRAGITIGWKDDTWNRISIQPNVYWDNIEFRTTGSAAI